MIKVLFVCLGNICRSPMAEGIFNETISKRGFSDKIEVDSAGTSAYHIGENPDTRAIEICRTKGVQLNHKGKQLKIADFDKFDYIIAMDRSNLQNILKLKDKAEVKTSIHLMREFDAARDGEEVPDPYYGGAEGFELVYNMLERASKGLLDHIIQKHNL